jgi:hypothetical protein
MFSSDNSIGGFHNDVLDAVPIDDESSLKLIEEIKNRAKGSISSQNYPVAITLYSKAIDICPPNSQGARAILLSNRSLCHFSMSNIDSAIDDADNSILADSSYLKVRLSFFCYVIFCILMCLPLILLFNALLYSFVLPCEILKLIHNLLQYHAMTSASSVFCILYSVFCILYSVFCFLCAAYA